MGRSIDRIDLSPGLVIYDTPADLILEDSLTSTRRKTLVKMRKIKHPPLVLDVGPLGVAVIYIASFSLSEISLSPPVKNTLVPVRPAMKEFEHEPISWTNHPGAPTACWVSARDRIVLKKAEYITFDDEKRFSAETAAFIDGPITATKLASSNK